MSNTNDQLIAELKEVLTSQKYSPVVVGNYCAYACWFLEYLTRRDIPIADVTEAQVKKYLRHAIRSFRKRHGRSPGARWHRSHAPGSTRCYGLCRASGHRPRK